MIIIAYNKDGYVLSILNAKNMDLAKAYLQGAKVEYDTLSTLSDFTNLDEHPTGVYPILKTHEYHGDYKMGNAVVVLKY